MSSCTPAEYSDRYIFGCLEMQLKSLNDKDCSYPSPPIPILNERMHIVLNPEPLDQFTVFHQHQILRILGRNTLHRIYGSNRFNFPFRTFDLITGSCPSMNAALAQYFGLHKQADLIFPCDPFGEYLNNDVAMVRLNEIWCRYIVALYDETAHKTPHAKKAEDWRERLYKPLLKCYDQEFNLRNAEVAVSDGDEVEERVEENMQAIDVEEQGRRIEERKTSRRKTLREIGEILKQKLVG